MKAFVVYESLWGNTAAVAQAIAEGIGPEARALTTDEASTDLVEAADLLVAGAPVLGFNLPTDSMRDSVARTEVDAPTPPDLAHPSMRSWLESLPHGQAPSAAFETRIWWSPRGATGAIEDRLERAGYRPIAKAQKFVVEGKYGPLRDGELERAREWGSSLAQVIADQDKVAAGARRG
jgi:flavorubredoxin